MGNRDINFVRNVAQRLEKNIGQVIIGKEETIKKVIIAFLCGGHVLLEDVPGSGKTMLAKSLAASVDGVFKRIQMTPDLLPADITGVNIFDMKTSEFRFVEGPVFSNILVADEINRATPKTQAGLLECMEEGQTTVDGVTYPLFHPFMVIATENPVDTLGVFPLPEAQIDRFLIKLSMEYPDRDSMITLLKTHLDKDVLAQISPVVTLDEVEQAMGIVEAVSVSEAVMEYVADLTQATREHEGVVLGVSQRGAIALLRASRCVAALNGRDFVLPDDIKYLAADVFSHRMILKSSERMKKHASSKIISQILENISVPTEETIG